MNREDTISFDEQIHYRLIALWVLCEGVQVTLQIFLRLLLVILTLCFLLNPLLSSLIKKWLSNQQIKSKSDINRMVFMLPSTKYIFLKSRQFSSATKGWKWASAFCKIVLVNILR